MPLSSERALAVGLEEPDGEKERPVARPLQQIQGNGHHVVGVAGADLDHLVVPDHVRLFGDVLLPDEGRPVP